MTVNREVIEGTQHQGVDESVVYTLTTTPWGSGPTSPTVAVYDLGGATQDVTATVAPGAASVVGDVISLPAITGLTAGHLYQVVVKFTLASNTLSAYFKIEAER